MRMLDVPPGVLLYCRRCDAEVPHHMYRFSTKLVAGLACTVGHIMHPMQPMVALSYDDTFSPIVLMLPRRAWNQAYVEQRERLQEQYLRAKRG